jgi:hypothetical protein
MGGASARHGDVEPHKKVALWSQPDPSQGDGRRVTKQQQVGDTVRKERVSIEDDVTGGNMCGPTDNVGELAAPGH